MSGNAGVSATDRIFRTSAIAIVAAVLLIGSVQNITRALQEPLQQAVVWMINRSIEQGHFAFNRIHDHAFWSVALTNFLIGAGALFLSYFLARWNYNRRSKP